MNLVMARADASPMAISPDMRLDNALTWVEGMMPIVLESGTEHCCLIVLDTKDGRAADIRHIGEMSFPDVLSIHTLETARYLEGRVSEMSYMNSYIRIDPITMQRAVAIRMQQEIWALGGCPSAEAIGILLYLLFVNKKADISMVTLIMHEHPTLSPKILEAFNMFCATMHATSPDISKKH
jgi:hypothetical protein